MSELLGVFAVKHNDSEVRAASRSGGVFTALSDYVLDQNGVVFGCILADDFLAYHVKATTKAERDRMRGSKYIQSNLGNVFREVKEELETHRLVLFSGTSCQVDGLKHFLGKEYNNLLCVDIVCHGVPSPKVWKAFLRWQERRNNKEVVTVDFRNKTDFGWAAHTETLFTKDGRKINSTVFRELFLRDNILRPACYECKYKSINHPGDITIADYWGIDKALPGFNDDKGVSLVLVNTEYGMNYYEKVLDAIESKPTDIEKSLQPALQHPFEKPESRDKFWLDFRTKDFKYIAKKYGGFESRIHGVVRRSMNKIARIINN